MRYVTLGDTFDFKFTTRRFSTGAPFTLAGSPVISAYPDNSGTEVTAGITLTADFDSRTGLNHVRVVATGGNGFAAGYWAFVITTGTVDGVSVVGETIYEVVIGAVPATVADKTGYRLSATGVDDVLDEVVEGTTTVRQSLRLANAANGGLTSGMDTGTPKARDLADTKDRIDATTDASGNRLTVALDLT